MQNPGVKDSTLDAIGNTPVVRLTRMLPSGAANVLVKLEYFNPTGSYKDRMALAMISEAEARGSLRPGMTVIEYTGGSTGSSLAFVCAVKGYRFQVVSSDAFAPEKLATMRAFGADVMIEASQGGQITPDLLPRMMDRVRTLATQVNGYRTDQLNNADSIKGYMGIGRELADQANGRIDVFCGGVGTAGMLVGVANVLKPLGTRIVALEPAASTPLAGGAAGAHHVEGIGIGFKPPLLDPGSHDEVRSVDEQLARETARRMAREEGIFGGTSSGLNVAAAIQLATELGPGRTVATVCVDSGLKYLAGDLYDFGSR